jgi:hypothetical protein
VTWADLFGWIVLAVIAYSLFRIGRWIFWWNDDWDRRHPVDAETAAGVSDMTDLEAAWEAVHSATPAGWFVGRPGQRHGGQWAIYGYDTREKAKIGPRSREWTAVGESEVECVREMARCLREIAAGTVPR